MVELSRYIENGEVKRGVITQDIKNRRLSHTELEELINNTKISSSFFGKEVDKKKPETEWDEAYLRRLSYASVIMTKEIYRKGDRVDIEKLRSAVVKSFIPTNVKAEFLEYISAEQATAVTALRRLVFDFFKAGEAIDKSRQFDTIEDWVHGVVDELNPSVKGYSNRQIDILMALIINEQFIRDRAYANILCSYTELFQSRGGVY